MEKRKIGGLQVSVVGIGCNNFGTRCDEEQTAAVVDSALDAGINFFDTADVYSGGVSEEFLGKALGAKRDEVVIATKFGSPMSRREGGEVKRIEDTGGGSRRWIMKAAEESLRRLSTDRIDLYQMHVPDGDVPIDETLEALNDLVREGKVLEIGCSNFSSEQIDESMEASAEKGFASWVSAQNHYSLLHRDVEQEVLDACERHGLAMLPYFPLASGLLTGKYTRAQAPPEGTRLGRLPEERRERWLTDRNFEIVERLEKFCADRGHTILEVAISWLAAQRTVASVIAGATKPEQVQANVAAVGWKLTPEDLEEVDRITS
jgi:aryl-alcohol dehydrogenase-like predicted oxidoreductase